MLTGSPSLRFNIRCYLQDLNAADHLSESAGFLECNEVLGDDKISSIGMPTDALRTPRSSIRSLEWYADQGGPTREQYLSLVEVKTVPTVFWTGYVSRLATIDEIGRAVGYTESTIEGAENSYTRLLQLVACVNDETTFKLSNKVRRELDNDNPEQ